MLQNNIGHVDAILMTHEHNDHIIGMDDVRPFNFMNRQDMPVFATERVQSQLIERFDYIFATKNRYPGAPMIQLHTIEKDQPFEVAGILVQPIEVLHGTLPVLGFRIGTFAYITDMKTISEVEFAKLAGLEHLVINALHHNPHHAHMNVEEATAFAKKVGAKSTYLTHASHRMGLHEEAQAQLPEGIFLAWDGLRVEVL
jgi:phosphoribosyl 1,2-cyclic phosphate phosphodiesterase